MIVTKTEFEACIEKCKKSAIVAVDTEFIWEKTYYPILGLIQLATEDESFLIDPLALDDLSPLGELMSSESTVKILHDALQDLQIIERATGVLPKNVFDTKLAAGFADNSCTLSLSALLELLVDVKLPKTESRTNWLQRPLSDKQIEYAIDDVIYMPKSYHKLVKMMEDNGTFGWFKEEMSSLENPKNYSEENIENKQFSKIIGSGRFSKNQLAILKELTFWREKVARKKDKPRNFIIKNHTLIDIAIKAPKERDQLSEIKELSSFCIKYQYRELLDCVKSGLECPADKCPTPFSPNLDRKSLRKLSDRVLSYTREKAEDLKIDPQVVTSRKGIEGYINKLYANKETVSNSLLTNGWRKEFFAELNPLVETL